MHRRCRTVASALGMTAVHRVGANGEPGPIPHKMSLLALRYAWSYATEVFLIQAIALIRLSSDDLQGTDHHPVILQDPPHFPAGQTVFLPLLPTLRIEHEINPKA